LGAVPFPVVIRLASAHFCIDPIPELAPIDEPFSPTETLHVEPSAHLAYADDFVDDNIIGMTYNFLIKNCNFKSDSGIK